MLDTLFRNLYNLIYSNHCQSFSENKGDCAPSMRTCYKISLRAKIMEDKVMKRTKQGFTIVELIIVIAVIGVLAAILIPALSSIIRKANIAKDVSLCKNMTTALAISYQQDGIYAAPQSIDGVLVNLVENGYNMDQLKSQTKGTAIYWLKTQNKIILVDKSEAQALNPDEYCSQWAVLWPKDLSALEGADKDNVFNLNTGTGIIPNYFALDHRITADTDWIEANQTVILSATESNPVTVSVDSADQLAALSLMIATPVSNVNPNMKSNSNTAIPHSNFENVTILLTGDIYLGNNAWSPIGAPVRSGEIDLNGTGNIVTFSHDGNKEYRFAGTFDGQQHKIAGLSMNKNYEPDCVYQNRFSLDAFTFGLFGSTFDATIKNVQMTSVAIDNRGLKTPEGDEICGDSIGAIVGLSSGDLTIYNCTVSGSLLSWDCVGGIVGRHYGSGDLVIKNCTNNASITAYGIDQDGFGKKAGGILGYAGCDFRDVIFENVINNGTITAGTAGGIASYMNSTQAADNGIINFKNVTNNGNVSNLFEGVYFKGGGVGGIFGSSLRANSKTQASVWENVINNGEVKSKNGSLASGIMTTVNSPLTLKGRIENKGNVTNEGSTSSATGMFGNITKNLTIDTNAVLKQKGDVSTQSQSAFGIAGAFGTNTVLTIKGKIEQSGDISNSAGAALGLFGNITSAEVNIDTGAIVKMSGDVKGITIASGMFGIASSTPVNIASGATVEISGNIICHGSESASIGKAYATGFISNYVGVAAKSVKLQVDGTLKVTSATIAAITNEEYTSNGIGYSTVSAGLIAFARYCDIEYGATSSVLVDDCNISAKATHAAYKGKVIAGGMIGSLSNGAATASSTVKGAATVRNSTISISATATAAADKSAAANFGLIGTSYVDTASFSFTDNNNTIVQ